MNTYIRKKAAMCGNLEKKRLTEALRSCDYCATNLEERSTCYKAVAKDSGLRAKSCILM